MLDPLDQKNRPYLAALAKKRSKTFRILSTESLILHSWRLFFWVLLFFGLWMLSLPSFFGQTVSVLSSLAFVIGFIYLFKKDILSFRFPDTKGLDHRIEKTSALPQGQIALTEDHLANPKKHDTRDLWNNAQKQSLLSFKNLKAPRIKPLLSRKDPSALRYVAVLLFLSGLMVSGPLWKERIFTGLIPVSPSYALSQGQSTNIWIKPPDYTQVPQIHIAGYGTHNKTLDIPEGSTIRIRTHSVFGSYFAPHLHNGDQNITMTHLGSGLYGIETTIEDGTSINVTQAFIPRARWNYHYIKDTPPEIRSDIKTSKSDTEGNDTETSAPAFDTDAQDDADEAVQDDEQSAANDTEEEEPDAQAAENNDTTLAEAPEITDDQRYEALDNNQIRFPLIVKDDYGVKDLRMTMHLDDIVIDRPLGEPAEEMRLVMSQPGVDFKISPIYDMTWHTWAGLPVTFTYEAIDQKGQVATLKQIKLTLPERIFEHPMAKSLIAMRKRLAWDYTGSFEDIATNLETLLNAPDYFQNNPTIYLAIRVARSRLLFNDKMPEKQRLQAAKEVINLLWYTALSVEEGDLSLAMRELQDAQRALENAMRDPNASQDEISKLMDNLREKMGNYFAEKQRDMQKRMENGEDFPTFSAENFGEFISPDTLSKMMEEIEQAMRDGDEQKAQELMSQLQRMMDMMDSSKGAQLPKDMQAMREGVNELQQLIERQESLIEQTQEQAEKQDTNSNAQQRQKSTMTPRDLPTLEKMLKDFGMDMVPPPPETADKEAAKEGSKQPSNNKKQDAQKQESQPNGSPSQNSDDKKSGGEKQQQQANGKNDNATGQSDSGVDTAQNKAEQDALRYVLGQIMMDAAEKLDDVPEKMGMAEQEMRGSAEALGENDPKGSLPHQDQAVQYLKDAQEDLAQQFKQRMQQMIGVGMSGFGQKFDPLGRSYDEDGNGNTTDSKVEVPDQLQKKRVDDIIKMLRDRSGDRSRPREELEYFRRLLRQF
mgnify:FL=1